MSERGHAEKSALAVGIVEDDDNIRAGVCRIISAEPGWEVRFACASLALARAAPLQAIDVLLVDIGLPDGSGLELLTEVSPELPVLIISAIGDEATVVHAIELGAAGYLLKDAHAKDLISSIRAVLEGGAPISPGVAGYLLRRMRTQALNARAAEAAGLAQLTPRESEVLRALTRGYSYEETGNLLRIARNTVGQHIKQIYSKLAVNSRSEAVFQAIQAGWLSSRGS